MDTKDLRKKTIDDLNKIADEKKDEIIELRRKTVTEDIDDVSVISKLRKDIARILTIKREKELAAREEEA